MVAAVSTGYCGEDDDDGWLVQCDFFVLSVPRSLLYVNDGSERVGFVAF